MLAKSIGERSRCHNFVVLYPTRAAVKRYGMITEARAQQLAPRGASLLSKVNRCLSQSQMLASLLYGPFPSRSATELKRAIGPSESFYNDLFVADVEDWPPEEPTGPNPVLADLESILQASSPISWKERFCTLYRAGLGIFQLRIGYDRVVSQEGFDCFRQILVSTCQNTHGPKVALVICSFPVASH